MTNDADPQSQKMPPKDTTRGRLNGLRQFTLFAQAVPGLLLYLAWLFGGFVWDWWHENLSIGCGVAGTFLVTLAVFMRLFAGRCHRCKGRLSRLFSCGARPWSVPRAFRYCPYCGASIDEEIIPKSEETKEKS